MKDPERPREPQLGEDPQPVPPYDRQPHGPPRDRPSRDRPPRDRPPRDRPSRDRPPRDRPPRDRHTRERGEPKGSGPQVTVIDAGVGNLGNVRRAFQHLGASVRVTRNPSEVSAARCLVLPGVGAFRPPRERLRGELEAAIRQALQDGAWLLGICVGYQLLFERGEEFGDLDGLALLPGLVRRLPEEVPLPHIGWNQLELAGEHPLLQGLSDQAYVYFVHSFAPAEVPAEACLASAQHGVTFPAIVAQGKVLGTQFHPEKSGDWGLALLRNFLELALGGPAAEQAQEQQS